MLSPSLGQKDGFFLQDFSANNFRIFQNVKFSCSVTSHVSPKRCYVSSKVHSVMCMKIENFVLTTVKTWNIVFRRTDISCCSFFLVFCFLICTSFPKCNEY